MNIEKAVNNVFQECIDIETLNEIAKALERIDFGKTKLTDEVLEEATDYLTSDTDMAWWFLSWYQAPEFCDYNDMIESLKETLREIHRIYNNE